MFLIVNDAVGLGVGTLELNDDNSICSQMWYFHSLQWKLCLRQASDKFGERCFDLFVECDSDLESLEYTCEAIFEAFLLTHTEGRNPYTKKSPKWNTFAQEATSWGWSNFISWKKLTDPANGFVKDNSFVIVTSVTAKSMNQGVQRE